MMKKAGTPILLLLLPLVLPPATALAQPTTILRPETSAAFEQYVKSLEREFRSALAEGQTVFLIDDRKNRVFLRNGEILVQRPEDHPRVKNGIIHEWFGAIFVPGVTSEAVISLLTDYDRHADIYPEVVASKTLSREGQISRGYLRLRKKKVITVVLDSEHEATVAQFGDRSYVISQSTRITQIENVGESDERTLPEGEDSGFLWRLNAYWVIDQVEDGVFLDCTTVSLSRDIPWGLGWMIRPIVEGMPRETLEATLKATRMVLNK
jgi:hypothetical protein